MVSCRERERERERERAREILNWHLQLSKDIGVHDMHELQWYINTLFTYESPMETHNMSGI